MNRFYRATWYFFRTFFSVYCRFRVYHPERVPQTGAAILVANHSSFLDPPLLGCGISRDIHYLARESLFRFPGFNRLLRLLNGVPLDRDGGRGAGLKTTLEHLQKGNAIILFPEGTRTRDGQLQPARSGIGLIVIKSCAPVIPIRVFGAFDVLGPGKVIPRPRQIIVTHGQPLWFESLRQEASQCSKPRLKEIYRQVADEIMAAIAQLQPRAEDDRQPKKAGAHGSDARMGHRN